MRKLKFHEKKLLKKVNFLEGKAVTKKPTLCVGTMLLAETITRRNLLFEFGGGKNKVLEFVLNGTETGEIDSGFFNGASRGEVSLLGTTETLNYPTDRWGEIVVEAGNSQETRFKDLVTTPVNKNKQCTAFIEAKGRRCV